MKKKGKKEITVNYVLGVNLNPCQTAKFTKVSKEGIKKLFKSDLQELEDIYFHCTTQDGDWYKILINSKKTGQLLFDVLAN